MDGAPKIFISHSAVEGDLAGHLASWIEDRFPNSKCFCSSRPGDLPAGTDWFRKIKEDAKSSKICLSLISPGSVTSPWIQFESGLIVASGDEKLLIPTLYGGVGVDKVPGTMRRFQYLRLDDARSMDAFLSERLLDGRHPQPRQRHGDFLRKMSPRTRRLLTFGELGLLASASAVTSSLRNDTFDAGRPKISIARQAEDGFLVAARANIVPRRLGLGNHWKFGFALMRNDASGPHRHFQFHAGSNYNVSSWTIYLSSDHNPPINIPATLHLERTSTLQLWLTDDGRSAGCVGIDTLGERSLIKSDTGADTWRLESSVWDELHIEAWADGAPFRVDCESIEIDRVRTD